MNTNMQVHNMVRLTLPTYDTTRHTEINYITNPSSEINLRFNLSAAETRGSVVVSTSAWHAAVRGSLPGPGTLLGLKTWLSTLEIVYLMCLSDETLKAVGPFYLVSMPGEVKDPTSLHWKCVSCRGLHILT